MRQKHGSEKIAWDLGLPFYKVRFDTIISSYLGSWRLTFKNCLKASTIIRVCFCLDEFDIIGKQRDVKSNDVGEIHRIVNILLGLLEEYEGEGILIASTNLEGIIDRALFRRFDDFIELPKPTETEIEKLLRMTFSALKLSRQIDFAKYSKDMVGMSYAIIVKVANDAAKKAVISMRDEISVEDLDKSLEENVAINK